MQATQSRQAAKIAEGNALNNLRKLNNQFSEWFRIWNETRPDQGPAREYIPDSRLNGGALVARASMERLKPLIAEQESILRNARIILAREKTSL